MHNPVPTLTRALDALTNLLAKAQSHCAERGISDEVLTGFRLFPDMFPLSRQVQLTCDFSVRCATRLSGSEVPSFPDVEVTFAELKDRIARARAAISDLPDSAFEGAETRTITLKTRSGERSMPGAEYLSGFVLPQVYFHLTTAYNILRHNGVALGKPDYMGAS